MARLFSRTMVGLLAGIAASIGFTTLAFAEAAPVYDADTLPPFEQGGYPHSPDQPAATARGERSQETEQSNGGFVPLQSDDSDSSSQAAVQETNRAMSQAPNASRPAEKLSIAERVRRLEQQMNNMQSSERNAKLDSLQSQVQALRSEVDQLSKTLREVQGQAKGGAVKPSSAAIPVKPQPPKTTTTNKALANNADNSSQDSDQDDTSDASDSDQQKPKTTTKKAAKPKAASPDAAETPPKAASDGDTNTAEVSQPNIAEEQQIYQTAYNLIKSKKYNEAITALRNMLKKYPTGQFASNAHYWLGELYGLSGKNDQALQEFTAVVKQYSSSPRVAEAQLKIGLIYAAQSKWTDAKTALKKVVNRYPGTTSARLASEQLKQIKQAGH